MIFDIPIYNQIINFDIINNHEIELDHKSLILNLTFVMWISPIKENLIAKNHLIFEKNKVDIFLKDNNELNLLLNNDILKTYITTLQQPS